MHARLQPCTAPAAWMVRPGREDAATPRPLDALLAEADAIEAPTGFVVLDGPHPGRADLEALIARLVARGLRVKLASSEEGLDAPRVARLVSAGLEALQLRWHGPAGHPALTGRRDAGVRALMRAVASQAGLRREVVVAVGRPTGGDLVDVARAAGVWGEALHLVGVPPDLRLPRAATLHRLGEVVLQAARDDLELVFEGLGGTRPIGSERPEPMDLSPQLVTALASDVLPPQATGGCRLGDDRRLHLRCAARMGGPEQLGHHLAAMGCPPVDRPPAQGGRGEGRPGALPVWTPPPGRRVALIVPAIADKALTLSTLPALREELAGRGADVAWWSVWGDAEGAEAEGARRHRDAMARARQAEAALWARLDLSDRDLVVVPGWGPALHVWTHPTLRPDARVVVVDLHLLEGIDDWKARYVTGRSMDGGWWPHERLQVQSCFPSMAPLYGHAGVPLSQVRWMPYPVHVAAPTVDAVGADHLFSGGNQARDWFTLHGAAQGGLAWPVDLWTRHGPPGDLPPDLRYRGTGPLPDFLVALGRLRALVLPTPYLPRGPSGLTVASMALAMGRPIVATATPGLADVVAHDRWGLRVPAQDPEALRDAIAALDDGTVRRLAAGAREAGRAVGVAAWADALLEGRPHRVGWWPSQVTTEAA